MFQFHTMHDIRGNKWPREQSGSDIFILLMSIDSLSLWSRLLAIYRRSTGFFLGIPVYKANETDYYNIHKYFCN